MNHEIFKILFISALIIETVWETFLAGKNIRWIKARSGLVPSYLKGKTTKDELKKASEYGAVKGKIGIFEGGFQLIFIVLIITFGWLGVLDNYFSDVENTYLRIIFYFGSLMLIQQVVGLPFSLYSVFVVEERFGFNKTTLRLFFLDMIKGLAIGAAIMFPLLFGMIWFISNFDLWWFYSWILLFSFSLIMMWLFPTFIAPLFNKFTPLPAGSMKQSIDDLANKCGFSLKEVKVMDASRRSKHSNAYFTGLGKVKRIILFDTLISSLNENEIISVLAHELGHFKKKHIPKSLFISQASLLGGLYLMNTVIDYDWIYKGLGLNMNPWSVLICFGLLLPRLSFWFTPLSGWYSRRNEFEADAYASDIIGTGEHLMNALMVMEKKNLSNPEPHPLYKKWHYSHPTVGERVDALTPGQTHNRKPPFKP